MISKAGEIAAAVAGERAYESEDRDWAEVFRHEFPRIYNYLRYRLGDDALAEDLAAETFVRAWHSRRQYEADLAAFSTWLFTIARNLAVDHFRQRPNEVGLEAAANLAGTERVDAHVQRQQDADRLIRLLEQLPARERDIIALRYGADMSHGEIAQQMGLSAVNVRVILFRAVRRLRAQWEDEAV